ncbi:allantoate amidohydrolase [Nocardioides daejeonensis]|uniref:allantoate amidohydrolase n=1 Tax=Nocardioides daejeonensis TaxID=1046556 RepID=UPI000D74BFD8|nr:allantoate amidohydrolase [Nocardioides daejeonensis]
MTFEAMWHDLAPIGRTASGGYFRQPFTAAERECHAWFLTECARRDLTVHTDGVGNVVAWWRPEGAAGPGVLTGSHLDSVLDGGAYDGPLGVVSALAALDLLRERGVAPSRPLGIGVFVEEEGSRFGSACLGSRLATGALTPAAATELRDRDGVWLADAMAEHGLAPTSSDLLDGVGVFLELHVEQGRALIDHDAAVGVASGIWPHGRYRFDFTGVADHAGTTRMEDRHDPMLTHAMTVLAANKQARLQGARATFGRIEVVPNGTNAVPSRVTGWLDARARDEEALTALVAAISTQAQDRAGRDGTSLQVTPESVSASVHFEPELAARLATEHDGGAWPVLPTQAGHDAGVLSLAGIPTAMLFVRNPTGVSHSPHEHAEMADCLLGVHALADSLERLLR